MLNTIKFISLENLQEIFDTRLNGRCVSAGYENCNISNFIVFDNIEMVTYTNGEIHFGEEEYPDAPYRFVFNTSEVEEIRFDDFSIMPGYTGGQAFIFFKNGDCLDITADF